MEALSRILVEYFPQFAAIITEIIFVVFLILNIVDDFDKIKKFIKRVFDFRKHIDSLFYAHLRNRYDKTMSNDKYLKWQKNIIDKIYGELLDKKNRELQELFKSSDYIPSINFSHLAFGDQFDKSYEAITIKVKPLDFPFKGVCSKDKDFFYPKSNISEEEYPEIQKKFKKFTKYYYRLVSQNIRYPNRLGFMLEDIVFDPNNPSQWKIKSYSGIYANNIKTSHVLEYELYRLYKKDKLLNLNIENADRETILRNLPIREYIHKQFGAEKEQDILTSGKYRSSLLGVQMFVIVKNYSGSYDALRIRRSADVAAKPGFLQFIPSGGFESLNDCSDYDSQWANYSITKVIFRELLEECFGQDEDDKKVSGKNVSPEKIYSNKHIHKLVEMLSADPPTAQMQLLGTSMSLVGLRQELSFIIRIDDNDFAADLISNHESKTAINMIDLRNLENHDFWIDKDLEKLNCTSAGLFELARESAIYKNCLNECDHLC